MFKSSQVPCGYLPILWLVVETLPSIQIFQGRGGGSHKVFLGKKKNLIIQTHTHNFFYLIPRNLHFLNLNAKWSYQGYYQIFLRSKYLKIYLASCHHIFYDHLIINQFRNGLINLCHKIQELILLVKFLYQQILSRGLIGDKEV